VLEEPAQLRADEEADAVRPSFVRRHAYAFLASVVLVALAGQAANQRWASPDFWVHLGAVREFASSLLHPGNPLVTGGARDPYMSPYAFVLGAIVHVTKGDPVTVLGIAGLVNGALLFGALHAFVRRVSSTEFAPLLALVFTLTAWGLSPWRWSGFFNLNSLGTVLPLSSTLASATGLLTLAAVIDVLRGESLTKLAIVGVGAALTVLCHPMTAVWVALVGVAFVVSEGSNGNRRRILAVVAVVAAAVLVASAWPYFSIWRLLTHSGPFDASNAAMYRDIVPRTFLAFPGFVLLGVRFVRRHRDPLALGAALNALVYVFGYVAHHDALGRVLPGILLMAHVAMAIWVAEVLAGRRAVSVDRSVVVAATAGIVALGLVGSAAGIVRLVPRALVPKGDSNNAAFASLVAPYAPLTGLIRRDDVVVAPRSLALGVAASSGKVIAPPAPAPFVADGAARAAVVAKLLSPQTSRSEFEGLVRTFDVKWFVVAPHDASLLTQRLLDGDLRVQMSTPSLRVFRVADAGSN
jgi:hypothetical protein